jgi:glycosyltransferase involved in cell wall biosynthesis
MHETRKYQEKHVRVGICFKDFASWTGISHIGLCVAALTNARVLSQNGVKTAVFPVKNNVDLVDSINEYNKEHEHPLTHVIVSAPWLSRFDMLSLIKAYPEIQFVIESHSNVGFLQADPQAVRLLRETLALSHQHHNIKVGGNSSRFVEWMHTVYGGDIVYLPNLYPLTCVREKYWNGSSPIKIGVFGAVRPLKNFMTAAAAAIAIHKLLGVDIELHMSTGGEGDGGDVRLAIDQMCKDQPGVTLIRHAWRPWQEFIEEIAQVDLMLQPSFTESFNMITADAISVGVASVCSSAITWVPDSWKADSDDAMDVARVGISLLNNQSAWDEGLKALETQNKKGVELWKRFLFRAPYHRHRNLIEKLQDIFT